MKFLNKLSDGSLRVLFTFIALYCFALASTTFIRSNFTERMTTDDCLWIEMYDKAKSDSGGIYIDQIIPGGVSDVAGLKNGDKLIAIDGIKLQNTMQAQDILNDYSKNDKVTYTVVRDNQILNVELSVYKVFNTINFVFSLLGFGFLFIGHLVGYSKPKELTSQLFFLMGCCAAIGFSSLNVSGIYKLTDFVVINRIIGLVFFYPLFLHFFMTYPVRIEIPYRKQILIVIYLLPVILSIIPANKANYQSSVNYFIGLILAISYMITGIIIFIRSYYNIKNENQRKPLRVILYGFLVCGIGSLYTGIIPLVTSKPNFLLTPWLFLPCALVLAIPISFGYSIIRYRILDTEFIIKKGLVFGIITAFIVGLYLILVLFLDSVLSQLFPGNKQILTIAVIIIVTFSFDFVNKKAKDFVDKQFYRERYNYRKSLLLFSEELPYLDNMRKVIENIGMSVKETMGIDNLNVWFRDLDYYKILAMEMESKSGNENVMHKSDLFNEAFSSLFQTDKEPKLLSEVHLHELNISEEYKEIIKKENFVLSIPIFIRNALIGAMNFGEKPSGKAYSDEDIDLLKTLASQAAISFENSRLQQEKISKQKIEEELQIARKIQMGLLPQKINSIKGIEISGFYNPATLIGGDFYDVIKLSDNKMLIVVADVSGKGIPAALYMSKVQAMIQFAAKIFPSPKEILIEVNKLIHQKIDKKSFITAIIALFDLEKMSVKICRAGHNPVIYSVNGKFELLNNKGMGLGLESEKFFESHLEETEIKLNPDNLFVFYSDGLTEAMNKNREEFGTGKVLDIVKINRDNSCTAIQNELINSVNSFRGNFEQNDDITLVITKIKSV
ncbi:MAG: SpoIIE family protein phosphatase [Ignavibacteria bacterium]|nr:SpoIIE family protein phosphatase [Ignavibacteria bacterium]